MVARSVPEKYNLRPEKSGYHTGDAAALKRGKAQDSRFKRIQNGSEVFWVQHNADVSDIMNIRNRLSGFPESSIF